ncbi:MAG: MoxR family ATPase [Planctomycetes bacterium]|nr:MoxR family ATPase [Planctomycetota bacterium]
MGKADLETELEIPYEKIERLVEEIEKVYIGERGRVELALVGLLANGHLIIEDVPGVGKTVLAHTIASCLDCEFRRIQFTPDLLPTDLLGVNVYDERESRFVFKRGPLFANIILADEINRTTPKTQSCLLEAMNEAQITVDGVVHPLPQPFCVFATQNPFEFEGTYPLPESQLDRFFLRMNLGYPTSEQSKKIIQAQKLYHPIEDVQPVMRASDVVEMQMLVRRVRVSQDILDYIQNIVEATRRHESVLTGASPRGGIHFYRSAQALAVLRGRNYVEPDDIKELALPVLSHRIRLQRVGASANFDEATQALRGILDEIPVPL